MSSNPKRGEFTKGKLTACSPKFAPTADRAYWTEIRPFKHYMVIGSELEGNGIQIFDMKKVSLSEEHSKFERD